MTRLVTSVLVLLVLSPAVLGAERVTSTRRLHHHGHSRYFGSRPSPPPPPPPTQPAPASTPCQPEEGIWRFGGTYNDPTQLVTSTAVECCDICRAEERCITWARQRSTGYCALKDQVLQAFFDNRYDSGFIDGSQAAQQAPAGQCFSQNGAIYPNGSVISRSRANSANACCRRCENNVNCFSWHRNRNNGMCVLNSNVPGMRRRGQFDGGSMV